MGNFSEQLWGDSHERDQWRNVDLDTARLTVSQQILSVEYEAKVADVKTSHSRRTIDLDPKTVAVLKAWRRQQRWTQAYLQATTALPPQ